MAKEIIIRGNRFSQNPDLGIVSLFCVEAVNNLVLMACQQEFNNTQAQTLARKLRGKDDLRNQDIRNNHAALAILTGLQPYIIIPTGQPRTVNYSNIAFPLSVVKIQE